MIQLNPRYEAIFASDNIDQDCDRIASLMSVEAKFINEALDAGLYKQGGRKTSSIILLPSSIFKCGSIRNSSRVPRYQNPQEVVGFCDFLVKSPNIGGDLVGVDVSWFVLCAKE